jgi:hypothetical protein
MSYNHETIRKRESETCPGVTFFLQKMTEGRRLDIRHRIAEPNRRVLALLKEQTEIEKVDEAARDVHRYMELQEEFDSLMLEKINPEWIKWGVKKIDGLEADGKPLGVDDYLEWPSMLFSEVLDAVKSEAELNGAEKKPSPSHFISGIPAEENHQLSIVASAEKRDSTETETVTDTTPLM